MPGLYRRHVQSIPAPSLMCWDLHTLAHSGSMAARPTIVHEVFFQQWSKILIVIRHYNHYFTIGQEEERSQKRSDENLLSIFLLFVAVINTNIVVKCWCDVYQSIIFRSSFSQTAYIHIRGKSTDVVPLALHVMCESNATPAGCLFKLHNMDVQTKT